MDPLKQYLLQMMTASPQQGVDPIAALLLQRLLEGSGGSPGGLGRDARGPQTSAERTADTFGQTLSGPRSQAQFGLNMAKNMMGPAIGVFSNPMTVAGLPSALKAGVEDAYENAFSRDPSYGFGRAAAKGAAKSMRELGAIDNPDVTNSLIGGVRGYANRAAVDAEERAARENKSLLGAMLGAISGMFGNPQSRTAMGPLGNPDMGDMSGLGQSGGMGKKGSDMDPGASGADGGYWAQGGATFANRPTTAHFGEPSTGGEEAIFIPQNMYRPGMQGNEDEVRVALLRAITNLGLGGNQEPPTQYDRPILPDTWKEAGTNLLRGLRWYGAENLKRQAGVPYTNPAQNALAQSQLAGNLDKLYEQANARRMVNQEYGGDPSKVFAPRQEHSFFDNPAEINEMTGKPTSVMRTTNEYDPKQRYLAEVLYNKGLPQDKPEQEAEFERRMIALRTLNEQTKANTAYKYAEQGRKRESDEVKAEAARQATEMKQQQININKSRATREGVDYATKLGHDPKDIGDDLEKSLDADGNINWVKFSRNLETNPARKEKIRQFNVKMDLMNKNAAASERRAREVSRRLGRSEIFQYYRSEMAQWRARFDAFRNNLANITKEFTEPPPDIEQMLAELGAGEQPVGTPRPQPTAPGGAVPFVTAPQGGDAVSNWLGMPPPGGPPSQQRR